MEFINNNRTIPRMRTVKKAAQEIKQLDSGIAMTDSLLFLAFCRASRRAKSFLLTLIPSLSISKTRQRKHSSQGKTMIPLLKMVSGGLFKGAV